jgi:hypothetical protein
VPHDGSRIEPHIGPADPGAVPRKTLSARDAAWAAWGLDPEPEGAADAAPPPRGRDNTGMASLLALVLLGAAAVLSTVFMIQT